MRSCPCLLGTHRVDLGPFLSLLLLLIFLLANAGTARNGAGQPLEASNSVGQAPAPLGILDPVKTPHLRGAYPADRASALSGVPVSTIHYWARTHVLLPSVSAERVKLWSYSDLMGLRTIYWLRQSKSPDNGQPIPATSMRAVRKALEALEAVDLGIWTEERGATVAVSRSGEIFFTQEDSVTTVSGQRALAGEWLDLIAPFETEQGCAPHLHRPRPSLRIVPGKLSGSPHIVKTRIETLALAALETRGLPEAKIAALYPAAPADSIAEALDLEHQLQQNLRAAA
jgi:uncharacterized protein (DUF433 family)